MSQGNGLWTDFLADFMALTEGVISPDIFKLWTGITMVAAALERRVWIKNGPRLAFPNLYTLLVAPPGVGKYIVEFARELMDEVHEPGTKVGAFKIAPDSVTNASLVDAIKAARAVRVQKKGEALEYHSLFVPAEEFQVLLPVYDMQMIATLNSIYNNKPLHRETRRTGAVRDVQIVNPQLNILAGAQPSYFASTFPEEAWSTGFARRIIMIYSPETPKYSLFGDAFENKELRERVKYKLSRMSQQYGQMRWRTEAVEFLSDWHDKGGPPVPQHSKLAHYVRTRSLNVLKLSIISCVSRTGGDLIELEDVKRALHWLLTAESLMPDIFREMIGKSDIQIIEEMHYFVSAIFHKNKQRPIQGAKIMHFLLQRCPTDKAEKIMLMTEKANIIARVAGEQDLWIPRPKEEHGVE